VTLQELTHGEAAIITKVRGRGAFRKRITEMGFVVGKKVTVVKKAPLQDPVEYRLMGYDVSLRNSEAQLIEIDKDAVEETNFNFPETFESGTIIEKPRSKEKLISVALVGNPNSGKTTLYNYASGSKEKVGNYSGVTVDAREAHFKQDGYSFVITDLPGTYSITAYTPEELYVRDFIFESVPDIVINVVDASNIERNLYLTTQLIDMDVRVIVALNMYDDLEKNGDKLDQRYLGELLGVPFVPTIASKGNGISDLFAKVIEVYEDRDYASRHIHIYYGHELEKSISSIQQKVRIPGNIEYLNKVSSRFFAIKLLEKDAAARQRATSLSNGQEIIKTSNYEIERAEVALKQDTESAFTDAKYGFISGALAETLTHNNKSRHNRSESIDTLLTHKFWGIPVFIFFMWSSFYFTFKLGKYPMEAIQWGVKQVSHLLQVSMPPGMLKDLIIQGIIGGVGGVITFLPNILILYLFISLMEDTGYMARAVFIMDKIMHKIGLHGKSFIPMIMGFGCNVPAVLSTRIIESRRDRIITMLINPFMSCSARLPVYILFISAFYPSYQGSILFFIYFLGISLAIVSALLFRKTIFRKKDLPFVMELPPYRVPTVKSLVKHMWDRAVQYLNKIAGVILIASIIIWALGYFPVNYNGKEQLENRLDQLERNYHDKLATGNISIQDCKSLTKEYELHSSEIRVAMQSERQRNSFIGRIGNFIEPVMRPLGFDWKMSVSVFSGISAKEVVVGTLGILYQPDVHNSGINSTLVSRLQNQAYTYGPQKGEKVFTPLVALSFMLFILIYFPCIGVVSAISRESGSWKWAFFIVVYTTLLAYLVSLTTFQFGSVLLK
jgi:ferrous iron transport protein B